MYEYGKIPYSMHWKVLGRFNCPCAREEVIPEPTSLGGGGGGRG